MNEPERLYLVKYLRLSLEDKTQGESESIGSQRAILEEYLLRHPDLGDYEIIELSDDGYSGTNFNRPAVKRLLELVRQRKVGCILVKDLSRFGRSYKEVGSYLEQVFPFLGVRFISATDGYDSAESDGLTAGISLALKNLAHDLYSWDISQKVKSSRRTRTLNGDYLCAVAPYGYVKSPSIKHRLEIDEPAAQIVRRIFSLLRSGVGTTEIARLLNREEVPPPLARLRTLYPGQKLSPVKNNFWTSDTVLNIIKNECYTGKVISGKWQSVCVGGKIRRRTPREEQVIALGRHKPIIPEQEFQEAQGCYQHLKKRGAGENTTRLLQGKVRCAGCNLAMKRSGGAQTYFYCRTNQVLDAPDCAAGTIGEKDLMKAVLLLIQQQVRSWVDEDVIMQRERENRIAQAASQETKARALKKRLNALRRARVELFEQFSAGMRTAEEYRYQREQTNRQLEELSALLKEAEGKSAALRAEPPTSPYIKILQPYEDIPELAGEMADILIRSIRVYAPDRVEVVWKHRDESPTLGG